MCVSTYINHTLWVNKTLQNIPTKMTISKILVLVGTFFGAHEENGIYITLSVAMFFENAESFL